MIFHTDAFSALCYGEWRVIVGDRPLLAKKRICLRLQYCCNNQTLVYDAT
jgi:hypothetical protein